MISIIIYYIFFIASKPFLFYINDSLYIINLILLLFIFYKLILNQ